MSTTLLTKKLAHLQSTATNVRNICILAHVDHGKTTLADALVASNGFISSRLAGQLRYMDSRPDEQERGITMKSSAISLFYSTNNQEYLINLIDSPGHVDFSSEVSTAVRLCDGAIVVVDVVEGVQPQTKVVLQQAWREGIRPVLVLNKIDRLIVELKLQPLDAFIRIKQVLEAVNAVIGELFASDVMGRDVEQKPDPIQIPGNNADIKDSEVFDWSSGLDEADDSELYFSPDSGNVLFASAVDGWAFGVDNFAKIYSAKLGFSEAVLKKTLWGDFFINTKTKKIMKGAQAKAKKPLFVQLILENIWALYEAIVAGRDREKVEKIVNSLQLKVSNRDLRSTDSKQQLTAIFSQWLPMAESLLKMVCLKLPPPTELSDERAEKLMCSRTSRFENLPEDTRALKSHFTKCSPDGPLIVFVSKMIPVPRKHLPENRPKVLSPEELAERREAARQRLAMKKAAESSDSCEPLMAEQLEALKSQAESLKVEANQVEDEGTAFVAFARVFSGTLEPGKTVYVIGPKYDPSLTAERLKEENTESRICDENLSIHTKTKHFHIMKAKVGKIYLLLGRELEELSFAPAGNIVGIGGLEDYILKSATLSTSWSCPPFVETTASSVPILRVAIEPAKSTDLSKLVHGLHLLNQADANVRVNLTDKGEHVLVTAGEVHLERCIRDLRETYAGVDVVVSEPVVPFRETIIEPPETDMVNEELNEENKILNTNDKQEETIIKLHTPNKQCCIEISALPLPAAATKLLESNVELIKEMDHRSEKSDGSRSVTLSESALSNIADLKSKLFEILSNHSELRYAVDRIWSFGPRRCGPNILIMMNPDEVQTTNVWSEERAKMNSATSEYESSIINGFQLATLSGPLCEEPLMGCAFIVHRWTIESSSCQDSTSGTYGPLSGQIVSTMKEGCRKAFQARPQRLAAAMYTCDIQVKSEVLGKMYAVLGKRHGRIVSENMVEGSSTFTVTAHLPVVESLQFANEIRKQTSGLAMPQLVFSHWEVIDTDPFWVPRTEEELLHFGDKADSENIARKYMNDVRRKKGLAVDEKLVEFAEKQRTVSKKK